MVCTLIDHRNDAIKCSKLDSESTRLPLVVHLSFEHFMASFLWSIRVQIMKKSGLFVKHQSRTERDRVYTEFELKVIPYDLL